MTDVFVVADNIISPLGWTSAENFQRLKAGYSGILLHDDPQRSPTPFYASLLDAAAGIRLEQTAVGTPSATAFEQLLIASIAAALADYPVDPQSPDTILIISTTKGNISLLESPAPADGLRQRIALSTSAKKVAGHFGFTNQPLVVSNACISGLLGILTALRLLQSGKYKQAVIAGADLISRFVLSGFQSFQAVSAEPCRPFDKDRTGISLGEAAATVVLSVNPAQGQPIKVLGGATGNDANHISGPSRTGKELSHLIQQVLRDAHLHPSDIDFVSAHGTATPYNDEMEAKAISLAGLDAAPVNSLKAYYGHTLGAAGLVESVITLASMKEDLILPTLGFREHGVSTPINIARSLLQTPLQHCLKTASGFGGCNATLLFGKSFV